jgi:mannose-1-phosphate guanylyltransferase/mannose-6-phosphate isomerase
MTELDFPLVPVVLSGGSGTRLWPASRLSQPKQLLPLVDDRSMLQATLDRVALITASASPIVVANVDHATAIMREVHASGYPDATLILEPVGRNTAAAAAVAAIRALKDGDPLILLLPADHTIGDEPVFRNAILSASEAADAGYLVTFGITPSRPETGYGYIKIGTPITPTVRRVAEFKEKPTSDVAMEYIASGGYLWNSGMFLMKASRYLEELEQHAPDIAASAIASFTAARIEGNSIYLDPDRFSETRSDSIDYAVMEHTSMAAVMSIDPGWNDVGSWASLWDLADKDERGNVVEGDVVSVDTSNTYVRGAGRLIATVGVENMVIVDTPDVVLVAARDSAQEVKSIVDILSEAKRSELATDGTGLTPWGRFRTVYSGAGFRVLHLSIDPGGRTTLNASDHASEHLHVVGGVARITTGDTTKLVPVGESVYIPAGEKHRLENPGDEALEVIEVDIGTGMAGDDFMRPSDKHGRTEGGK